ncbi:hypothetical protein BT67DRAFT_463225 [Trichocladium antarcticum]|uniref:Uncharacterized protein n=1 Tax=Trichocladium antarcticum TaxID=1450529 RepID=A0AAN6ZCK4_9PEZI|nr:hypothetical protein BT67DRAFT_463225 [Trichocladium antarcticum]
MRAWLVAKAEEDKRKQEEERTRQEGYRLEQRRMEHEILRTSLQGGIPPPLVPVVFAGMGGGALSPAALEWAQQFMMSQSTQQHQPALMPPGAVSLEHQRRDSQAQMYGQYPASGGVPSTPGSAHGLPSAYVSGYPGSPRPRGLSMPGTVAGRPLGGGPKLPNLNTNVPGGPGNSQQQQQQQQQQEAQPSPSIYFHHWQPPTTQGGGRGGTDQPATPSGSSKPKSRSWAIGPQHAAPPPPTTTTTTTTTTQQRHRSPPLSHSSAGLSNPPSSRRRGHTRQRSDLGSYRPGGRSCGESPGPGREMSPMHMSGGSAAQDCGEPAFSTQHQPQVSQFAPPPAQAAAPARAGPHSVSSLLSDSPAQSRQIPAQFASSSTGNPSEGRHMQAQLHHHQLHHQQQAFGESGRRKSPRLSEDGMRGGRRGPGSAATRPGDND